MASKSALAIHFLSAGAAIGAANYNLPFGRPYTLRTFEPMPLERELARQIDSKGPLSFIFPRPCASELDSSRVCGESHGFTYAAPGLGRQLSASPAAGYEFRRSGEDVSVFEAGVLADGRSGPLSFYLDARMYTELHEDPSHASYDREFVERQDREASGSIVYSSYSRYRSTVSYDLDWARFTAGRDVVHWGPGLYANLSFNQEAVPFNHVTWLFHLGPVTAISLYGRLAIHGDSLGTFDETSASRSIYAHRYEWRVLDDLLLGISEQLVLFEREEPFAFIPAIPLFIAKGTAGERNNNGNISIDATYRFRGFAHLYTEFFVDDLQSPTSLFDDYWGNKWAWMFGARLLHRTSMGEAGLTLEYSRVEPWVYTHYTPGTAQTANAGHPLGNPLGPDSQWMIFKPYFRGAGGWYASVQAELSWKGRSPGSSLDDASAGGAQDKVFLFGVGRPEIGVSPHVMFELRQVLLEASARLGSESALTVALRWRY